MFFKNSSVLCYILFMKNYDKIDLVSKKADIIYKNYSIVDNIINGIQRALSTGMSWEEIKKRLDEEKTPEAEVIKEIKETEGIVIIFLDGKEIEIDFRKSVEENAERY